MPKSTKRTQVRVVGQNSMAGLKTTKAKVATKKSSQMVVSEARLKLPFKLYFATNATRDEMETFEKISGNRLLTIQEIRVLFHIDEFRPIYYRGKTLARNQTGKIVEFHSRSKDRPKRAMGFFVEAGDLITDLYLCRYMYHDFEKRTQEMRIRAPLTIAAMLAAADGKFKQKIANKRVRNGYEIHKKKAKCYKKEQAIRARN